MRVPTLSDSVASGTLLPWHKAVGETVARDETLVDLETDKVILEIPAPASGLVVEVTQPEGTVVKAGEVVAVIETGEGIAVETPVAKKKTPAAKGKTRTAAPPPVPAAAAPRPDVPLPAAAPVGSAAAPGERPHPANVMPKPTTREPMSRLRQRVAER
ncbi:MAG: biotin/lipoyl-containing protein, partial [Rubrivivax sp.]|nr:biotin/lipoyl-containing protein [Rubrivivax sp.]